MKKILCILFMAVIAASMLVGCNQGASEQAASSYEGYWFILAEYDADGQEVNAYGNTRFNITLTKDGKFNMYSERYNYQKKIWFERQDSIPGFSYTYDTDKEELLVQSPKGSNIVFRQATYNGSDVVEMLPINSGKEKTILSRTNPKPK